MKLAHEKSKLHVFYKPSEIAQGLAVAWNNLPVNDKNPMDLSAFKRIDTVRRFDPIRDLYESHKTGIIRSMAGYQTSSKVQINSNIESLQRGAIKEAETHGFPIGMLKIDFENPHHLRILKTKLERLPGILSIAFVD
jgi:hypothetical protein